MSKKENQRVFLRSRPGVDKEPKVANFGCEVCPFPEEPGNGEALFETLYLSVDPLMRCLMNEDSGVVYASAWGMGDTIKGSAVATVIKSKSPNLEVGDLVTPKGFSWPFQLYTVQDESSVLKLENLNRKNASLALGLFGINGLTSAIGVMERGNIVPNSNQTMVVSAAAGSCGSIAGQVGKILGCGKLIGICGSPEKCEFIVEYFGFDEAICYKTEDVHSEIKRICPGGVDVYFDNVGGDISNAVINCMNKNSSVILCGQIAVYNDNVPYPPPLPADIVELIAQREISRERFLVLNYPEKFMHALSFLMDSYKNCQIKNHETVTTGLENTGQAFIEMMNGKNIGKQIVKL